MNVNESNTTELPPLEKTLCHERGDVDDDRALLARAVSANGDGTFTVDPITMQHIANKLAECDREIKCLNAELGALQAERQRLLTAQAVIEELEREPELEDHA